MRICLIAGIFGKPAEYRATVERTPETVLASGLRARGHDVVEFGHHDDVDFRDYELVHVHHFGYGAVLAASRGGQQPFVFTNHGFLHLPFSRRVAASYVLARATATVVLSEAEASWQRQQFPRMVAPRYIIPNGIDTTVFHYRPLRLPEPGQPWNLLYVGQLARIKAVHYLLRALPLLGPRFPIELRLVYHVDTEEQALRREASRLGLRDIHFLGPRRQSALADLYSQSHLVVLPSLSEALPSVISEALLVGRPIVATDVGGVRGQVGGFGTVVRPGDPQSLADGITAVLSRYSVLASDAHRVSDRAATTYSIDTMLDAHEVLYRDCTEARRVPRTRRERMLTRIVPALLPLGRHLSQAESE